MEEQNILNWKKSMDRETSKKINEWLHYVRGKAVGEKRRIVRSNNIPIDWSLNGTEPVHPMAIQTEDVMVVEIPVRELASMTETQEWYQQNIGGFSMRELDKIIRNKHSEEYLRKAHPGLQEYWERYQVMLALCSDESFN